MPKQCPTRVFISYSHADKRWLERLKRHLSPMVREGRLDYWDDTRIRPGDNWQKEVRTALDTAQIAVFLISADFLASDFIDENELLPLLAAAQDKGVLILPVIISASRFSSNPSLAQFQAVNPSDRPLVKMSRAEREEIFNKLAETIDRYLHSLDPPPAPPLPVPNIVIDHSEKIRPNLSSTIGSIHVHIDGGENRQLARKCTELIDQKWSKSEIAQVTNFVDGPQRKHMPGVYVQHTPTKTGKECLQFFSTTVIHDGDSDPSGYELAEIEDKVRRILGTISVEPKESGEIVVEAERVVGLIGADGDARWAKTLSLPSAFGPAFTFAKKNAFAERRLYEVHFAIDIPLRSEVELPISLADLAQASEQAGILVGGWFTFWKPNKCAYRSNMFLNSLNQDRIHLDRERLNEQLRKTSGIDPAQLSVRVIIEESLGVWRTPFEKLDAESLTVPELAAWEKGVRPGATIWVVTGNFLGDQHTAVKDAMLRNFAMDCKYVYFLQSFADLARWQRFRQDLEEENKISVNKMQAFVIDLEQSEIWSEKLDCFIAHCGSDSEGYKLTRDPYTNNIIKARPLEMERIDKVKALFDPLLRERDIVSTFRYVRETFVDGSIIWLDFGYFETIRQGKSDDGKLAQFVDDYDCEISADVSKCGGEVARSSETGFVIILARKAYERESEIVGRAFRLAKTMLDRLTEVKILRGLGIDVGSHRLVLGYGSIRRYVRSSGYTITGNLFRECRQRAAILDPGRTLALAEVYRILADAKSPWLGLLSPVGEGAFDVDWSRSSNSDSV